jgi:FtsP/CotA-like multicopper oxidase with cupredoxin domain
MEIIPPLKRPLTSSTRTYTFQATQYGTSWYHSHYSVQYGGGVLGPIIVNGPTTANWDIDVGALPLTDWFYEDIFTAETQQQHATGPLTANNALVNGSMVAVSGTGGSYSVTVVQPGEKHLLRIINTGVNQYFRVSIDDHPMTVVAADWTPIVPYNTSSITVAIGMLFNRIILARY